MNSQTKQCQNCKKEFIIAPEDFDFYAKIQVPAPNFCPDCRLQRRLAFRNERTLYKRNCDLCKLGMVSVYHKECPYTVYCQKCWWSDNWDPMEYGKDYDFEKPFFEQFIELQSKVPKISLFIYGNNVNSEYVNYESDEKNCYLTVGGHFNENCLYSTYLIKSKDSIDNYFLSQCELCYWCISSYKLYQSFFCVYCFDSINVILSYNCKGCSNVIGGINLRNKQYCILNKQYTKEEYLDFLKNNDTGSYKNLERLKKQTKEHFLKFPHKSNLINKSVNSSGNYLDQCNNCVYSYDIEKAENCKYYFVGTEMKDCYDCTALGFKTSLCYEILAGMAGYKEKFSYASKEIINIEYSDNIRSSSNLFGCISLRNKQYCILNKQYTKEEYEKLVPKIIEHMG